MIMIFGKTETGRTLRLFDPQAALDLTQFAFDLPRYLVLLYYNPQKMQAKVDAKVKRDEIERLKKKLETETSI